MGSFQRRNGSKPCFSAGGFRVKVLLVLPESQWRAVRLTKDCGSQADRINIHRWGPVKWRWVITAPNEMELRSVPSVHRRRLQRPTSWWTTNWPTQKLKHTSHESVKARSRSRSRSRSGFQIFSLGANLSLESIKVTCYWSGNKFIRENLWSVKTKSRSSLKYFIAGLK